MDLFEYQARDVFAKHGVPVLNGIVATTPEEARAAAESLGGRAVVKAQVKIGVVARPVASSSLATLRTRQRRPPRF